jgi:hypothetical protein
MPVHYFAPKVNVKLIDFPPRDNRGQNNEQSECLLRPHLFIPPDPGFTSAPHCETFSLIKTIFFVSLEATKITSKIEISEIGDVGHVTYSFIAMLFI